MRIKYRCGRCGTEREDAADAVLTSEGWLCTFCQDTDYLAELVAAGHPRDDARRIVALQRNEI